MNKLVSKQLCIETTGNQPRWSWIMNATNWISDSLSVELGFRLPIISGIPDSLSWNPDSKAQDSGFHRQKSTKSGLPYIGWWLVSKQLGIKMTGKLPKQPYLLRLVSFRDMESLCVSLKKEHSQPSMTSDSSCLATRVWWSLSSVLCKHDSSLIQLSNPCWRDGITGGVRICRK